MDAILDILNELKPGIDYRTRHDLVDTRELDSLTIITLVSELEDAFDITIPAVDEIIRDIPEAVGEVIVGAGDRAVCA